jgi:hypothetical protein
VRRVIPFGPGAGTGKAEGEAKGLAVGLMAVFAALGLSISPLQQAQILGCSDPVQLGQWLEAAATADDVIAVLGK